MFCRSNLKSFAMTDLDQRRDCERVVHAGLGVAHPHLQCVEEWMQPDVPPDFFALSMQPVLTSSLQ